MQHRTYLLDKKILSTTIIIDGWMRVKVKGFFHYRKAKKLIEAFIYVETATGARRV